MAVESATYISGLVPANPAGSDALVEGDNHLRLIKSVLQATFPNLNGPVTLTPLQLNQVLPAGVITLWAGNHLNVPTTWGLCDGTVYSKIDGSGSLPSPNLTEYFVRGTNNNAHTTGGTTSHTHNVTVGYHALTTNEMPSHNHGLNDPGHNHYVNDPGHQHSFGMGQTGNNMQTVYGSSNLATTYYTNAIGTGIYLSAAATGATVGFSGSSWGHTHEGSVTAAGGNEPVFYRLCYIMKL